jgi:Mg2+ and Co2+ transporter CorA
VNGRDWLISPAKCFDQEQLTMAAWMTALKLVPWGEVIEATPQILQAAKKLMGKTREGKDESAADSPGAGKHPLPLAPDAMQLQRLYDRITQLEQEQRESATLIQSLAEQNAAVIKAVDALRLRNRRLTQAMVALSALGLGLLAWALLQ